MNLRTGAALLIVAFIGGAIAYGWYASDSYAPWMATESPPKVSSVPLAPPSAAVTAFIPAQPVVADSAQTEAMLLSITARRAIENGKSLGALLPRLQATFGPTHPQAMAVLADAGEQPLSNAALLMEFDTVAEQLVRPAGTGWDRIKYEAETLFVLRRGDRAKSPSSARLGRVRQNLISGETEAALRLVKALPGAPNAADWIVKAERAVAVQKALTVLDQAAVAAITAPVPIPAMQAGPTPALSAPSVTVPEDRTVLPVDGE